MTFYEEEFPNLVGSGKRLVRNNTIWKIGFVFSMIFFTSAVLVFVFAELFVIGFYLILFGISSIVLSFGITFSNPSNKSYTAILDYAKTRNIVELIKIPKKTRNATKLVIYALLDLGEFEEATNLVNDLENSISRFRKAVVGSNTGAYLRLIRNANPNEEDEELISDSDLYISKRKIDKVFLLDKLPPKAKCMISFAELDINHHSILACPFCEGLAKEDLFKKWLKENKKCPKCKRELLIDNLVYVKKK